MRWRAQSFFENKGAVSDVLHKNNFVSDLLGSQYLLEMIQSLLTFKNNENGVKSGCFEKLLRWRAPIFYQNDGKI